MAINISLDEIKNAARAVAGLVIRTPAVLSPELSRVYGCSVYLKLENLQYTGAFKIRGNSFKLLNMAERALASGVVTASSGNHGLGLSLAARRLSASAKIVVPSKTPANKVEKIKSYGAEVIICGETYDDSAARAKAFAEEEGRIYVPSFDDRDIIAGNAGMGLEIHDDVPGAELVVCPVGGGGGISGISLALKQLSPGIRVVGVQAEGACSMARSIESGGRRELESADTIADGIAVRMPGELTFPIVRDLAEKIVLVSDEEIIRAVGMLAKCARVVAEPAGAAAVAALDRIDDLPRGGSVVCLISGGNIDKDRLVEALGSKF